MGNSFIRFCTITNNTANIGGGGLQGDSNTTNAKVSNTIIAKNVVNDPTSQAVRDVQNGFISEGYNLIGVVSTAMGYVATDIYALHPAAAIDPNIGALADNGGDTFTHALLNPSPAYNAANPSSTLTEDQRGTMRPQFGARDIGAFESTTVLPVELLTFKGESTGKSVVLKWQTASEINNAGFIVERSKDAKHFEQIGFVVGKGNTTELISYQFIDNFMATSLHYYRLKQTDFDGTFEYSNIIAVNIKNDELDKPIRLFPNPVQASFTIENAEGLGILYNAFGQAVKQIQITDNQQDVVITDLPTGIYWLQIRQTNGENMRIQIVKTK